MGSSPGKAIVPTTVRATIGRGSPSGQAPGSDPDTIRQTRRFDWTGHALPPVTGVLPPGQFRRLRYALALTFGAEAVIVLRPCCLDPGEATQIMRWAVGKVLLSVWAKDRSVASSSRLDRPPAAAVPVPAACARSPGR